MLPDIPNYTLLKKLGAGAFAEVWLAEHRINRRRVAIKILKENIAAGSDAEALFIREGEVLASFNQRNIVTIYDNARAGEHAWLIMELLPGGSLLDRMQAQGVEVGEAIGHIVQIAAALDAAHARGIIHRDLKPANIMLRDETTPVLTDFGASRMLERSTIYGRDGGVVGTPQYMSPEQITGQPLDGRSDLYALGVMFHELLTGRSPFAGSTLQEVLAQHLHAPLPQLPAGLVVLQPLLDRLLAKDRSQRFASGAALSDALRRCFLDEQALRTLIRFPPSSAWSSQLRSLGFDLDTAQRTEVRIAQGDFLKEQTPSTATPAERAVPATPAAAAAVAAPVPSSSTAAAPQRVQPSPSPFLATLLSACAWAAAAIVVLVFSLGVSNHDGPAESALIRAFPLLVAMGALVWWLAWRQRRWLLLGFATLQTLCALAAAVIGEWMLAPDAGASAGVWLLPSALAGALLLAVWVWILRRRSWIVPTLLALALATAWTLCIVLADAEDWIMGLLTAAVLLTVALWVLLASSGRPPSPWVAAPPLSARGRLLAGVVAFTLAVPVLIGPLIAWQRWKALAALIAGRWYGISADGRVMVDFEAGGQLVQYGTGDGEQRPWLGYWTLRGDRHRTSGTLSASPNDDGTWHAAHFLAGDGIADLVLAPSYSFNRSADPQPWVLRRSDEIPGTGAAPLRPQMLDVDCPEQRRFSFLLDEQGGGQVSGEGVDGHIRWMPAQQSDRLRAWAILQRSARNPALPDYAELPMVDSEADARLVFDGRTQDCTVSGR